MKENHNRKLEHQNFNSEKEFYKTITKEGSLGILAYGYRGLLLWRKKKAELEGDSKDHFDSSIVR